MSRRGYRHPYLSGYACDSPLVSELQIQTLQFRHKREQGERVRPFGLSDRLKARNGFEAEGRVAALISRVARAKDLHGRRKRSLCLRER